MLKPGEDSQVLARRLIWKSGAASKRKLTLVIVQISNVVRFIIAKRFRIFSQK